MRRRCLPVLLAAVLLLSGCGQTPEPEDKLHILCTTYPVYLFTTSVTQQLSRTEKEVQVELLVNSQTSCLHDYSLTVEDMKAIERADVIVMNGAGLEDFMADALARSDAVVIDCSEGMELLSAPDGEGPDPHYWMDPYRAFQMRDSLSQSLQDIIQLEHRVYASYDLVDPATLLGELSCPYLITFHDGFRYFAQAHGLELLKAIEEEEGSTASAAEIKEIVGLIRQYDIPAVFVEKNGSRATAEVIARETGCAIYELDMLMSGDGTGLQPYFDAMAANRTAIQEALS